MAELLGIIGSIGAVVNIIDATNKAISAINDVRARWKDADLILISLVSQLTAFRAALRRIQEWMSNEMPEQHHQLVMDLDDTLSYCAILVSRIEVLFADWELLTERPTAATSRWKVAIGNKGFDNVLVLVERQTNALTLLLTACNCKSISEQKRHLERPKTRKVLQRAKTDSVPLFVHQDTSSFRSRIPDSLSKLSLIFDFDPQVFSSDVYNRVIRGSLKCFTRQKKEQQQREQSRNPSQPAQTVVAKSEPQGDAILQAKSRNVPEGKDFAAWTLSDGHGLTVVAPCQAKMVRDCARFTFDVLRRLPKLRKNYAVGLLVRLLKSVPRPRIRAHNRRSRMST